MTRQDRLFELAFGSQVVEQNLTKLIIQRLLAAFGYKFNGPPVFDLGKRVLLLLRVQDREFVVRVVIGRIVLDHVPKEPRSFVNPSVFHVVSAPQVKDALLHFPPMFTDEFHVSSL